MTGETIDGRDAVRIGLANEVYPAAGFREAVRAFASKIAAKAPLAISLAKAYIDAGAESNVRTALTFETEAVVAAFLSEDAQEGMRAYQEKRAPTFRGR